MFLRRGDRGQVTVFVIVAVVIIAAAVAFFFARGGLGSKVPAFMEPVYTTFSSCVEDYTLTGVDILESQGGYIYLPQYEIGSGYMPFSSQLDFMGNPIPYWYYVSGNNIAKQQVPSKNEMEEQLAQYIEERIGDCVYDQYYENGFEILTESPSADVKINDGNVVVNLNMDLEVNRNDESATVSNHKVTVDSNLGVLYSDALKVYEQEQEELFLEDYAIDVLRLYAPVDGVELTCAPKVWNGEEIVSTLRNATEANTLALKSGKEFTLSDEKNEYFVLDLPVESEVRFLNFASWPYALNVEPSEGSLLVSKPVGNQPGLGVIGFCYAPYHFVYDYKYPVLIQLQKEGETFQFPMAVVIQGNQPRTALNVTAEEFNTVNLCEYQNTPVDVNVYDSQLNLINADISYECFGVRCEIGSTSSGLLEGNFPQCVNGFVRASANGYRDAKVMHSTVNPGEVDLILDKLYETDIKLMVDGRETNQEAVISFTLDNSSTTVVYPEQRSINLSEGQYEISVYMYRNSSLRLEGTLTEQCVDVPRSGLGGILGLTREECYSVEIPSQLVTNALSGGGKQNYYILESELANSNTIEINAESLPSPVSLEQLQQNYILYGDQGLEVNFK